MHISRSQDGLLSHLQFWEDLRFLLWTLLKRNSDNYVLDSTITCAVSFFVTPVDFSFWVTGEERESKGRTTDVVVGNICRLLVCHSVGAVFQICVTVLVVIFVSWGGAYNRCMPGARMPKVSASFERTPFERTPFQGTPFERTPFGTSKSEGFSGRPVHGNFVALILCVWLFRASI